MTGDALLKEHLQSGLTHVCRCWAVRRADGQQVGFTDHDGPLEFEGIRFEADSGLSASALAASTGLSVNNSEAVGLLQSDKITETDIRSGKFDGAEVTMWHVCWDNTEARTVKFRGTLGEITWSEGTFQADLRGLTEPLNQLQGRSYLRGCSAVLGDTRCGVDLSNPDFSVEAAVKSIPDSGITIDAIAFPDGWFADGVLTVLTGQAAGLSATIRDDRSAGDETKISLWKSLPIEPVEGDKIRLSVGCDRRAETCRTKFSNLVNFRGFPDIPGEDWLVSVPRAGSANDGGSLR